MIEADPFGEGQEKQVEDDLGYSDQNVLCGMNPSAGRGLKDENRRGTPDQEKGVHTSGTD